jgi:two-component system, cell cycle sensor histidine kinase and response regulator CckA
LKKILVVDNHPLMLEFMSKFLSAEGYQVQTAEDGLTALDILKNFAADVVFIDLIMPNISGEKLCRIIRSDPKLNGVHLVILSAVAAEQEIDILKFGANALIAKGPFTKMPRHVLRLLEKLDGKPSDTIEKGVIGIEDVHARAITKELLSSKRHFELILDNISEGIIELTLEGKIIYANPTAVFLIGSSEEHLLSIDFVTLFRGNHLEKVKGLLKSIRETFLPVAGDAPVGLNEKQVRITLLPVTDDTHKTIIVILNDVTDQKRLETQLQRAQKMEAIGALAGGVAHDLNNILSGLVSYPELILLEVPEMSPLRKPIETMQRSGEKAVAIVQDLLTLARRGVTVTEVVDLNQITAEYLKSPEFEKLAKYHPKVIVKADFDESLLNILGSTVHLSKTVMNLVSNASEAMPDGGTVTISTENRYIDQPITGYDNVQEGDYATITVIDTGYGIPKEGLERIFEPFYTKKIMGRSGTGLGMTVVYGTVKDHNGYIDVHSTEGKGTRFTLYFPITREKYIEARSLVKVEDYMGAGQKILVVDDVEEQRFIASGILEKLGYSVKSASSGEKAIEFLKQHSVDLVILDMIMDPGMSGLNTYRQIIALRPRQKAIITSGFSETRDVKEAQKLGAGSYIKKPYTMEKIGLAVKEELDK